MLRTIPLSNTASAKVKKLSSLEFCFLDMHLTAAFLRPDSYIQAIDEAIVIRNGRVYEIYVILIDIAILSLVFSDKGRLALLDFELTTSIEEEIRTGASAQ